MKNRRQFIKSASLGLALPTLLPFSTNAGSKPLQGPMSLKEGATILFQGDSITDAGRDRGAYYANNAQGLGNGYALLASGRLLADHADANYQVYNRGISGNKVYQLDERWKDDCLNLQPDVLSILIGVNDYWHTLSGRYDGTADTYERDFRELLKRTKATLPEVKLVVGEPFAVEGGQAIDAGKWFPKFDTYRAAARKIAQEFQAAFIPYHSIFSDALKAAPASYWCPDGVHPSIAGAQLMANAWMEAFHSL